MSLASRARTTLTAGTWLSWRTADAAAPYLEQDAHRCCWWSVSPWYVVESDINKHARLSMIPHLLSTIPYAQVPGPQVELPERLSPATGYQRRPRELPRYEPDYAAKLMARRRWDDRTVRAVDARRARRRPDAGVLVGGPGL